MLLKKIRKQADFLTEIGKNDEAELLHEYIASIEFNDATNREGHAAKVYFNALFGLDFTRSAECVTNAALNYGYSIILSAVNREVTANGYLTQIGLFHDNMFNCFNLSCDIMEPFRILIDRRVKGANYTLFGTEEKHDIISLLNDTVEIDGNKHNVLNAIKIYCRSVFDALNDNDVSEIKFYTRLYCKIINFAMSGNNIFGRRLRRLSRRSYCPRKAYGFAAAVGGIANNVLFAIEDSI